jgi:large subunit ribosomal protein L1
MSKNKISKRQKLFKEKVAPGKVYAFADALALLQSIPACKFDESVDVAVMLGIDTNKSEQTVRSSAVFAQGDQAEAAKSAGADIIGFDDLAETIKSGEINFDILIATPASMRVVGQLGQILGPKGLMPNPKTGTVAQDVATAVKNAKSGQVQYRADKAGIVHCTIGKRSFTATALTENLVTLLADLKKVKPTTSKGVYLKKVVVSSTMGPGLVVDIASI